jgi:hypothetical protein
MPLRNAALGIGSQIVQTNIVGVPPEDIAELIKQQGKLSALLEEKNARLAEALELKDGQVRAALKIVYEADVPSEQQGAKLIEIAKRFKALLAGSLTTPDDTSKIVGLKNDVRAAIEAGDLASA